MADQLDENTLKADVDKNLARLYLDEGLLQKAAAILEQAEVLANKIQAREIQAEILIERARFFIIIGDVEKAKQCVQQAYNLIDLHNLQRLRPILGVYQGEILAAQGKADTAVKLWQETFQLAQKLQQRRPRVEAMLGLAQALSRGSNPTELIKILVQIDKDNRILGSRKLRAKFLAVRGLVTYRQTEIVDNKIFQQALQNMTSTGLPVLERQMLNVLIDFYREQNNHEQVALYEEDDKRLLEKGSVDLHLVMPRRELFKLVPVSLVV